MNKPGPEKSGPFHFNTILGKINCIFLIKFADKEKITNLDVEIKHKTKWKTQQKKPKKLVGHLRKVKLKCLNT